MYRPCSSLCREAHPVGGRLDPAESEHQGRPERQAGARIGCCHLQPLRGCMHVWPRRLAHAELKPPACMVLLSNVAHPTCPIHMTALTALTRSGTVCRARVYEVSGGADLAVSPICPRHSMRIMSHTGSVALGALLLSGSEGLSRFPACASCIICHTRVTSELS